MAVVVITGASSGIGETTARLLAKQGHKLAIAARRVDRLEALAKDLVEQTEVLVVPTDVSDPTAIHNLAKVTYEKFGVIDVWINNAGIGGSSIQWLEAGVENAQQAISINLTAPILATQAVFPYMKKQGRGQIINIASVAGHIGTNSMYSATKFGLRGHSEALRRELRPHGIYVSVISPGFVRTAMTAHRKMAMMPGPEVVANAISKVIRKPRREIVVPGWYRFLIALNRFFPWIADMLLTPKEGKIKVLGEK